MRGVSEMKVISKDISIVELRFAAPKSAITKGTNRRTSSTVSRPRPLAAHHTAPSTQPDDRRATGFGQPAGGSESQGMISRCVRQLARTRSWWMSSDTPQTLLTATAALRRSLSLLFQPSPLSAARTGRNLKNHATFRWSSAFLDGIVRNDVCAIHDVVEVCLHKIISRGSLIATCQRRRVGCKMARR